MVALLSQLILDGHLLLPEIRKLWAETPFAWGSADCDLSVADYVIRATGIDPAEKWRGAYATEAEALEYQRLAGGNLALVDEGMCGAGFQRVKPERGAVIVAQFEEQQITGICTGSKCLFRLERGVIEMRARIVGAWA